LTSATHMAINYQTFKCPYCHDSGWVIQKMPSAEAYGPSMSDWPDVDVAAPCPKCGGKKAPYDGCGFPKEFSEADITRFKWDEYGRDMSRIQQITDTFWNNYSAWSMEGNGLYIWSKTRGSGKTFLACCLGQSVRVKYKIGVKFITSVDYLEKVSESFREENRGRDESRVYRDCELLILDDLGAESRSQKTNWTDKEFFRLLGGRFSQGKVTIITSNLALTGLDMDERITSRINAKSIIVNLPDVSIRGRQAERKKGEFINRLTRI